jgi:hypothetical protein
MSSCKVSGCRNASKHITFGHQCGKCGKFGHGQIECGSVFKKNELKQYKNDKIYNPCDSNGCNFKNLHTNEGHKCFKCNRFHSIQYCIIQTFSDTQSRFSGHLSDINPEQFFGSQNNTFVKVYVGMGCEVYIRKKNNDILSLFMHSDSWGQYGPTTDDTPILDKFIEGLNEKDYIPPQFSNVIVLEKKCPLCRKKVDNIVDIKGSGDKCSICIDKNVEIFFSDCNHAVTCKECYDKL